MTDGWVFLFLTSLICLGAFLVGLRFWRMPEDQIDGVQMEMPFKTNLEPIGQVRLLGKTLLFAAPLLWFLFIALSFGVFGPIEGIRTIRVG